MRVSEFFRDIGRPIAYYPIMAKLTGSIKSALFLCQLLYWSGKQKDPDGWIYKTQAEWEAETGLSRAEQEGARKLLKKNRLIEEKYSGMPRLLFYRPSMESIDIVYEKVMSENDAKVCDKSDSMYAENKQAFLDKKDDNHAGLNAILTCTENTTESTTNNYNVELQKVPYKEIVEYLNSKIGTSYRYTTAVTKKLINARYRDGFTLDDFKLVIDYKVAEWKDNEKMVQYLRPATLFSGKMDWYCQQATQAVKPKRVPRKTFK